MQLRIIRSACLSRIQAQRQSVLPTAVPWLERDRRSTGCRRSDSKHHVLRQFTFFMRSVRRHQRKLERGWLTDSLLGMLFWYASAGGRIGCWCRQSQQTADESRSWGSWKGPKHADCFRELTDITAACSVDKWSVVLFLYITVAVRLSLRKVCPPRETMKSMASQERSSCALPSWSSIIAGSCVLPSR